MALASIGTLPRPHMHAHKHKNIHLGVATMALGSIGALSLTQLRSSSPRTHEHKHTCTLDGAGHSICGYYYTQPGCAQSSGSGAAGARIPFRSRLCHLNVHRVHCIPTLSSARGRIAWPRLLRMPSPSSLLMHTVVDTDS